jgi:hypothetical protein
VITRKHDNEIREIKLALLASCFFFELRQAPRFDPSGFYICQGEIRTRIDYTASPAYGEPCLAEFGISTSTSHDRYILNITGRQERELGSH